jgi:large subunit ribosomal protein L11
MGETQKISSLVTGGAASAGPPLGPALGPLGLNIMEVISAINERTADFEGMKVPVTISVNSATKEYEIDVGIPSVAPLILKEAGIQKGSGTAGTEWVGEITMDSVAKIARTKLETSYATALKPVAKTVVGTCQALGVKVESKTPREITAEIDGGVWDEKLQD